MTPVLEVYPKLQYSRLNQSLDWTNQEVYRQGNTQADASFLCTALGGDHDKDSFTVKVVDPPSLSSYYSSQKL